MPSSESVFLVSITKFGFFISSRFVVVVIGVVGVVGNASGLLFSIIIAVVVVVVVGDDEALWDKTRSF